ncbi:putative choline transporter, neither null mutation nor overexpression affects choline transport, partial [Lobulomyces angularis]
MSYYNSQQTQWSQSQQQPLYHPAPSTTYPNYNDKNYNNNQYNQQYHDPQQQYYQQNNQYYQQNNQYAPPPSNAPLTTASAEKFVKKPKYNDVWASILFFLVLAAFGVCAYFGVNTAKDVYLNIISKPKDASKPVDSPLTKISERDILYTVAIGVGGGFVFSLIYFFMMQLFAGSLIIIQSILLVASLLGVSAWYFYQAVYIPAVVFLVIGLLFAWFFFSWRSRIPFAKVMLKTVTKIISGYPATILTGIFGLILEMIFLTVFLVTVFGWIVKINGPETFGIDENNNSTLNTNSNSTNGGFNTRNTRRTVNSSYALY